MFKKNYKKIFLSLLLLAGVFFLTRGAGAQLGLNEINNGLNGSLTATDPRILAGRIITIGLGFLGIIAVGLIIYAGFIWMTANGEEEKISTAQKILKNAVIGLVIILMSWAIANFVLSRFGGAINPPGDICTDLDTRVCGCGGTETCIANTWGSCIGSDCSSCTTNCGPASCDGSIILPGCQATADICAPSNYCDPGDCGCKPRGNLGDPCSSASDTCQADNNRCAEFLTCNPTTCTCFGPPVITEISPVGGFCENDVNRSCSEDSNCSPSTCDLTTPNGKASNFLTILGKNFGVYSATSSRVVFEGNSSNSRDGVPPHDLNIACINTWRDDQIVIAVPAGASNGPIKVVNRDNLSDNTASSTPGPVLPDFQANNIIRPGLCYLNPASGTLNSQIGYGGINLSFGTAYFGNYKNNVRALDSQFGSPGLVGTSTTPNIRSGVSGSFVRNILSGQPENSNFLRFTKYPEPTEGPFISSFAPINGTAGQYVTIRGSGFGGARGGNHVYFSTQATSTEASYNFPEVCLNSVWKNNQIVVKVPAGLVNGAQTIEITLGTTTIDTQKLNPPAFNFNINTELTPSLCKIEPERGPVGTPVSLWGEYFGTGEGLVRFNSNKDATGTIGLDGRASKIPTAVPVGAITGPVKVIHNSVGGNEMNFAVGECTTDAECGTQVCCPASTYKKGRCANTLAACFIDIPNSVFEWSFSTGFGTTTVNPDAYSCAGLAQYYGSCQTGSSCPNVPGTCSPYPGGGKQAVGSCDYSCDTVPGCSALSPCSYNVSLNKCVKNNATCDLPQTFTASTTPATPETCNADGHWEITIPTSCPDGWTRGANNRCVNLNSSCLVCSANLTCQKIQSADTVGSCVSPAVCPSGSTCEDNPTGPDRCVITTQPTCDCCCQIGQDARDCCAPLRCEGSCGADTNSSSPTLGKCGGCKSAGNTTEARDAACNCSGHNGQFCDINNTAFPDGVCTDCSGIKPSDCSDHSSVCCRDSRKTLDPANDICRGGDGRIISNSTSSLEYGYCAYYDCSNIPNSPPQCASTTPVVIGAYPSVAACVGDCQQADPCPTLTTLSACQANSRCCFDAKKTAATTDDVCRLGTAISSGADNGYCGYYDCADRTTDDAARFRSRSFAAFNSFSASTSTPPQICASTTPVKLGTYNNIAACEYSCANPPAGAGLSCAGSTSTSTCATSLCTYPSMGCFDRDGNLRGNPEDCGTCCCQPGDIDPLTNFKCVANQGACTGAVRGLFCGCKSDTECGAPTTTGCGASTCCQARPEIASTSPAHLADKVCRNAVVKINFNQLMDAGTSNNNVLLLEERPYNNGVCPTGSFVAGNSLSDIITPPNKNWLARLVENIQAKLARLTGRVAEEAQATLPDSSKLYCAVAGTVYGENNVDNGSLIFSPEKILSPKANYYLIVKGDENLNSQTGVLSAAKIGFNGRGYFDESTNTYVPGQVVLFNNRGYKNSQIFKFTTLSAQGPSAGICAVDHTAVTPVSRLFKTTSNALASEENDTDPNSPTFDIANDKDKVFTATAYSVDKQILQPVTGYFWDWDFRIDNPSVAVSTAVSGLAANKLFVTAVSGVTDGETTVTATINMNRFQNSCTSGSCSCQGDNCSNNCCNAYSGGDGFNSLANLYVFICNNPWPPVGSSGNWSPWVDTNSNCLPSSGNCADYNYKFYYCRDAGAAGTLDDLPAILNPPVIRGQGSNLLCSADRSSCSVFNAACGPDNNGDGSLDGICIWDILKESYFFREVILPSGQSLLATDARTGGKINLTWSSAAAQVGAYKIYYLKSGNGTMQSQEVKASLVCTTSAGFNNCAAAISGLTNNIPYVFKISVISVNRTESQLSAEVTAKPTDQTPPAAPVNLRTTVSTTTILFAWQANTDDSVKYRLYHGIRSGAYGESFDSAPRITTLSFPSGRFSTTTPNYFAVSALDASGNESTKSVEINDNNWAE